MPPKENPLFGWEGGERFVNYLGWWDYEGVGDLATPSFGVGVGVVEPAEEGDDGGNGEDSTTENGPAEVVQGVVEDCLCVGVPDRPEEDGEEDNGGDEDVEEGWREGDAVTEVGESLRLFLQFSFVGGEALVGGLGALVEHFGKVLDKYVVNPALLLYCFLWDDECTCPTHLLNAIGNVGQ